jgi:hypothetical protein
MCENFLIEYAAIKRKMAKYHQGQRLMSKDRKKSSTLSGLAKQPMLNKISPLIKSQAWRDR